MEWFKKNKKIVIGVLVVVVLACISVGAYLVSGNGEPKKANKENTEKTVEKQEDSEEVQDEEQAKENVNTETVVDDTTQTEKDEVAEETTETTQPSTSANDTTSNSNNTTNNNTTSGNSNKGNSGNKNSTTNKNTNSGSTTNNSSNNTNSGNSGNTTNSGSTTGKPSDGMVNAMGTPLTPKQAAAVNAGYYKVATSSQGYSLVVPSHLEYDKGCKIIYDYIESLGYERAGASSAYITEGYYGIYVDYENLHKIPTEDDIVWG